MKTEFCKDYGIDSDRTLHYIIYEHYGVLNTFPTGWRKEINLVAWNGSDPKIDIREWNQDHTQMAKGITLFNHEFNTLKEIIKDITL